MSGLLNGFDTSIVDEKAKVGPRWVKRMPVWLSAAVEFFEADGWILIPALILAAVW